MSETREYRASTASQKQRRITLWLAVRPASTGVVMLTEAKTKNEHAENLRSLIWEVPKPSHLDIATTPSHHSPSLTVVYPTLPLIDTSPFDSDIQYPDLGPEGSSDDEYFVTAPASPVIQGEAVVKPVASSSIHHLEQIEKQLTRLELSPIEPTSHPKGEPPDAAHYTLTRTSPNISLTFPRSHSPSLFSQSPRGDDWRPEDYDYYPSPESESDPRPDPEQEASQAQPDLHPEPSLPFTTLATLWSQPPKAFPMRGPPCLACRRPSSFGRVSPSNTNGNALRPYYRCGPCNRWVTWADMRGVRDTNVACACGVPSRECITGRRALCGPGKRFWVCVEGRCRFMRWDDEERQGPLLLDAKDGLGLSGAGSAKEEREKKGWCCGRVIY
ncbi:GRF-type domain-containing protein [Madurella fahalii]|uniref:GRF-type domain-containing protein n=1 Tax=Madurella fahalii TaxID=1157608 RepID=A0ABQ0GFI3_9PEZI